MQIINDNLLSAIATDSGHIYFDSLQKNEPTIDWLGFAAKIYKRSDSTKSVVTYCKGIHTFREFAQTNSKTVGEIIAELKSQNNGLVYKVLDEFSTYCHTRKGYAPKTTETYLQAVKRLFTFVDIDIDDKKFRDKVTMPRKKHTLKDEYPSNEVIQAILNVATPRIRAYVQVICDTGLEPVDAAQLKPKYFRFNEDPIRLVIDREKTGEEIETFISKTTADILQLIIRNDNLKPEDYFFIRKQGGLNLATQYLRLDYNKAVAKAGYGELVHKPKKTCYALVQKIDGHKFGKYHLKVLKKRWFSLAATVVPEYVAQAMLGRKQYLDQYFRLPLEKKQEYARKILRAVSIYKDKNDKAEVAEQVAKTLGLQNVDAATIERLAGIFSKFMTLPGDKIDKITKILNEGN